jgi:hypothetical protein
MAEIEKTEFEFPDEKEEKQAQEEKVNEVQAAEAEAEEDIEVVDDTPEEDRGRAPLKNPPEDVTEEELNQYTDNVRKRLQHFSRGYHDERRRAEAALREKEEALKLAQSIIEENKRLKGSLNKGQEALLNQAKISVGLEIEQAKKAYREAYDAGDADALVAAQDALTAAKIKADRIESFTPNTLQEEEKGVETQSTVQAPAPDPRAVEWQRQNRWFGQDEEMTSFALGLHQKLMRMGVDPRSDEYYERLNSRMRQVFPESFDSTDDTEKVEKPTRAKASVVAPATRSTAAKKVVLTQTQVNIAKRLGVPLELYAKKVAEEARKQNG